MTDETQGLLRAAGFAVAGSLFWLEYWDLKDRARPEPRRRLVAAFAVGVASACFALALYRILEALGIGAHPTSDLRREFLVCMFLVGPLEEGSKFFAARTVVFRWRTFDERVDGFIYAAAVALGFAAFENFFYLPALDARGQVIRTLCAPLVHTLFASLWGWGTAHALIAVRGRGARFLWQAGSLAAAALVHGAYDFALHAGAPPPVVAAIVAVLWVVVILGARRALAADDSERKTPPCPEGGTEPPGRSTLPR
ncbi:MAG: hypothetical protein HMLKMBBP_00789 [Planctomycetes bacterium]|nr:hypothetical protein [Planctomycetota bacterium]